MDDISLQNMVDFFQSSGVKVVAIGFGPKPEIGWKASDGKFYCDGLPIPEADALKAWREGSAKFLPQAEKHCYGLAMALKRAHNRN